MAQDLEVRAAAAEARAERDVYWKLGRSLREALPEDAEKDRVTLEGLLAGLAVGGMSAALLATVLIGGELGYDYANTQLVGGGAAALEFPAVNPLLVEWAQAHVGEAIVGIDQTTRRLVREEYLAWLNEGGSIPQLTAALRAGPFSRARARTIAITETTAGHAWAANQTYQASGVVAGLQVRTAADDRVCPICAPLEGQNVMAPLGGGFVHPGGAEEAQRYAGQTYALPPFHSNCRCRLVPVLA